MSKKPFIKLPVDIALSVRQPWAWLIVNGHKDVENRTWSTRFRGKFLVHTGKRFDTKGYKWVQRRFKNINMPPKADFDKGGIVGIAKIVDCVTKCKSKWFTGGYGFKLQNAAPLPFVPMKGRTFFFKIK